MQKKSGEKTDIKKESSKNEKGTKRRFSFFGSKNKVEENPSSNQIKLNPQSTQTVFQPFSPPQTNYESFTDVKKSAPPVSTGHQYENIPTEILDAQKMGLPNQGQSQSDPALNAVIPLPASSKNRDPEKRKTHREENFARIPNLSALNSQDNKPARPETTKTSTSELNKSWRTRRSKKEVEELLNNQPKVENSDSENNTNSNLTMQ